MVNPFQSVLNTYQEFEKITREQLHGLDEWNLREGDHVGVGGRGGFSVVRCLSRDGKKWALKSPLGFFQTCPTVYDWERMLKEGRVMIRFSQHPCFPKIAGYMTCPLCLVLPFLDGGGGEKGTIMSRVDTGELDPVLGLQSVVDVLIRVATAMDFMHCNGWVHCDIKTDNVVFDDDGLAYMADFGLSLRVGSKPPEPVGNNHW